MADFDPFRHPEHIQSTGRSRAIAVLQRYYDSEQYEGCADWWTGIRKGQELAGPVPLRERKPCVIYELPKAAVQQVVRFLFGDGKFPQLRVEPVEEPDEFQRPLSEDDAALIQTWLAELIDRCKIKPLMRSLARRGLAMKTAVAVLSVRRGEFRVQMPRAQDCWARFEDGDPALPVTRLVWSYEYDREVGDAEGRPRSARYRFRREWDDKNVYVYEDVEVKTGVKLEWGTPQQKPHGFTFCPVVWIPNMQDDSSSGMDGVGLFEGLEDEFDALNFAYSQRHRGIHYWGTPQPYETGVEPEDSPHADGRTAVSKPLQDSVHYQSEAARKFAEEHPEVTSSQPARKISPDSIWSYADDKVTVELLETSGKSFDVATNHINDIRSRLLEQMGVVLTSMADTVSRVTAGSQMSGRFLALAHAPLLNLTSELRHFWWPFGLQRVLHVAMKMAIELEGKRLLVPGSAKVAEILKKHYVEVEGGEGRMFLPPKITPLWGTFFDPSAQEIKQRVDAAAAAKKAALISAETGTRFVSEDFGIENPEKELELIEEAAEEETPDETGDDEGDDGGSEGNDDEPPDETDGETQGDKADSAVDK